jgi:hypothetical protein
MIGFARILVCEGNINFQIPNRLFFQFIVMILNVNSDGTVLIARVHLVRHMSFLHYFDVHWVPRDKSVALVINTGNNVR